MRPGLLAVCFLLASVSVFAEDSDDVEDEESLDLLQQFRLQTAQLEKLTFLIEEVMKSARDNPEAREQAEKNFLSAYNSTNDVSHHWLLQVISSDSNESSESFIAAVFEEFKSDFKSVRKAFSMAIGYFRTSVLVHDFYLMLTKAPHREIDEANAQARKDFEIVKQRLAEARALYKREIWQRFWKQDIMTFINRSRTSPRIGELVLHYLREKYPFRSWIVVSYSSLTPPAVCIESDPGLAIPLDGRKSLFVAHTNVARFKPKLTLRANELLSRVSDWKLSFICERRAGDIFTSMKHACHSGSRFGLVGVFLYQKERVKYLTTHPLFLRGRSVRRSMWPFCWARYDVVVFV